MNSLHKTKRGKSRKLALNQRKVRRELLLGARRRKLLDNCLQDVQGLLLRFHVVGLAIQKRTRAARLMEETLNRADGVLANIRDRAKALVP